MSARADILAGKFAKSPAGSAALTKAGGVGPVATLFAGFVGYANATWSYSAQSGGQTAANALSGDGPKSLACGTIREALKLMLREDLGLTDVANADINEYFITKPGLECFDPKVKGNLGNHGSQNFGLGCHFSTHYFLSTGGKFYDPCLMAVYSGERQPIGETTKLVTGCPGGLRSAGTGKDLIILHLLAGRSLPGFGSVWEILTPKECKTALAKNELAWVMNDFTVKASKVF